MDEKNQLKKVSGKTTAAEKKKRKRRTVGLIIFGVIAVALIVVIINWRAIFAPMRDMFLPVGKAGFPVNLPGSAAYNMGELGGNFYLLTDTYLYTYTGSGAEIKSVQHGFNRPASSSTDRRVLVYDKNGKDFRVYSKSEEIFAKTMDDAIVFSKMGSGDRSAVVTTSTRYSNYLYIFTSEGKQQFRWASPEEKIMGICFSDNGQFIYVSVVGEKDGELNCAVLCFDITKEQNELWRASTGSSVSYTLDYSSDGIYTVTENGAYLFDRETGEIKAQNSFTKQVTGVCNSKEMRVVLFHDSASNGVTAVVYDENLLPSASLSLGEADSVDIEGQTLYVLSEDNLSAYDKELIERNSYQLDNDYSNVMIMDGGAFLLGYNTVQRVNL
ncbi:MAG: hypothetical protein J6C38_03300 [Oscillospiraceae bacterium]|nr:hypothetical protein [Oscillospiraceae bacterium]